MGVYRSAGGKMIDMDKLRTKNSDTRAVGNMNVNARGDTLDSNNNVVNDSSSRVNKIYQQSMINSGKLPRRVEVQQPPAQNTFSQLKADPITYSEPIIVAPPPVEQEPEFLDEELELDFGSDEEPVGKPAVETNQENQVETKASTKKKK